MKLNREQRINLRQALILAFTDKTKLKIMLSDYLDVRLNRIVSDENNNYEEIVFELIDWAREQNQVKELVLGAMKANSNNPHLQSFFRNNVINLLVDNDNKINSNLVEKLISILEQSEKFELIKSAGFYALPDLQVLKDNNLQDIKNLENIRIWEVFKIFILLNMLLNDYPKKDDTLAILIFADRLSQTTQKPELQNQLKAWVQEVNQKYGFSLPQVQNPQSSQPRSNIEAYLMITVRPATELGKFHLNAYLELPENDIIPIDLAEDSSQKGVTISFKKKSDGQAPKEIINFITETEKILRDKTNQLKYKIYHLNLELFLPFDCLHENIDQWKLPIIIGRTDLQTIGERCTVVFRSYERIDDYKNSGHLWNDLKKEWDKIKTICKQRENSPDSDTFNSYFEYCEIEKDLRLDPCLPKSKQKRVEMFKTIIYAGIPLAIWNRNQRLTSPELDEYKCFMRYLNWDFFDKPNQFFAELNKMRSKANKSINSKHLGYHLGILYEPVRWNGDMPPFLENTSFFSE